MNTSLAGTQICLQCHHPNPPEAQRCSRCHAELDRTLLQTTDLPSQAALAPTDSPAGSPASLPANLPASSPAAPSAQDRADPDPHLPSFACLTHTGTGEYLNLDPHGFVWRLGKPHQGASPDIDISQFPRAEIVSRAHALIRYDRGQYYIEDTNSSNGTFVNHAALIPGRRYPLKDGDYVVFGKGDLVSFRFRIRAASGDSSSANPARAVECPTRQET
ncbi:MAG: FHA domain-containing protein [Geitlerinemataceae cyanobacterium]